MSKHSENRKIKKVIVILLIVVFIASCIYIAKYFYDKYRTNKASSILSTVEVDSAKITKDKTEKMLQLEELQKENSDIIGWIKLKGTNIDYPVLQSKDNSFYMTHNYKKEYAKNGSIFLDKDYDWTLPSTNLLLYGHNNQDGTMFQDLIKYKEESFYKDHPTINFTTTAEDAEYQIIAVFLSRVYYKSEMNVFRYYYFIKAENEEDFNSYIQNSKEASLYETGNTAVYGEQLLTLSTCSYHTEDGRLAIVAKKI